SASSPRTCGRPRRSWLCCSWPVCRPFPRTTTRRPRSTGPTHSSVSGGSPFRCYGPPSWSPCCSARWTRYACSTSRTCSPGTRTRWPRCRCTRNASWWPNRSWVTPTHCPRSRSSSSCSWGWPSSAGWGGTWWVTWPRGRRRDDGTDREAVRCAGTDPTSPTKGCAAVGGQLTQAARPARGTGVVPVSLFVDGHDEPAHGFGGDHGAQHLPWPVRLRQLRTGRRTGVPFLLAQLAGRGVRDHAHLYPRGVVGRLRTG